MQFSSNFAVNNKLALDMTTINKNYVFSIFLALTFSFVSAQEKKTVEKEIPKKENIWNNFIFGGNLALQVGTVTLIDVSPNVGYIITPRLVAGLGASYEYYKDSYYSNFSSNIFGIRTYTEYILLNNIGKNLPVKANFAIFSHVEYEALNLDRDFSNTKSIGKVGRFWLNGILLGGGIKQPVGKHTSFNIAILYNINADARTPYENPIIRIGFYF
jgi:hypothetical protein